MPSPIFLDANIPIYAAGRPHPLREPSARILGLVAEQPERFVSDAEVVQELLHRYIALRMWDTGQHMVERFLVLMEGRLEPISALDVGEAARLATPNDGMSARDLLHVAVMQRLGVTHIVSADADYDRVGGITRLDPAQWSVWASALSLNS